MKRFPLVFVTVIVSSPVLILLMVSVSLVIGSGAVWASGWEYRARVEFTGPLEEVLSIRMMSEVRSGSGFQTHKESHFDLGLEWAPVRWLGIAPYYRNVTMKTGAAWVAEHRPHLNVTFKWSAMGMRLSDRNRVEYRMIESARQVRYRNRLMLALPAFASLRLVPHVSTEPYYDFDAGEVNRNRLISGFDMKLWGPASLKLEYVLDSIKGSDRWHEVNSLLMALKYKP